MARHMFRKVGDAFWEDLGAEGIMELVAGQALSWKTKEELGEKRFEEARERAREDTGWDLGEDFDPETGKVPIPVPLTESDVLAIAHQVAMLRVGDGPEIQFEIREVPDPEPVLPVTPEAILQPMDCSGDDAPGCPDCGTTMTKHTDCPKSPAGSVCHHCINCYNTMGHSS